MIYTVTFNPSIDYIVRMDGEINNGLTNRSSSESYFIGGKGINVSIVLKELGLESTALGFTAGFTGNEIIDGLGSKGIKSDFVMLPGGFSRINVKLKNSGTETEINAAGPNIPEDSLKELLSKIDKLKSGDVLILAGSIPKSLPNTIYEEILDMLKDRDILFIVDASGSLLTKVLKYHPFLIKPNLQEIEEIFNVKLRSREEILKYAGKLRESGARNVIVSLGAEGALLYSEEGKTYYEKALDGKVINTVGAGDSMVAGFLTGYLKDKNYELALKLGSASGAATAFSDDLSKGEKIYELYRNSLL